MLEFHGKCGGNEGDDFLLSLLVFRCSDFLDFSSIRSERRGNMTSELNLGNL